MRRTASLRDRIRSPIEEMVEQELEVALGRGHFEQTAVLLGISIAIANGS